MFIENQIQIRINHIFTLGEIDDDPLNSNDMYKNIYYSLAYIIRVSNPNISTDAAGDNYKWNLTATGNLFVSNVGIGTTSPAGIRCEWFYSGSI